ncbi:extracellular solute-binding protein, partial [bacterium]
MRIFFATTGAVLAVAAVATWWSQPQVAAGRPVLFWVTDPAPARAVQIEAFHAWLQARGDVDADGGPAATLRIDPNNGDQDKIMIQGVAGVAGDLIDTRSGDQLRLFNSLGILTDLTGEAHARGFGTADTWPATEPDLAVDGRQFAFPCNVTTRELWVNKAVFERLGQPLPAARWTFDEFEAAGRAFIAAANASPGARGGEPTFFCDDVPLETMYRSLGLGLFNETMTACDLDDPRYVDVLRRKHRWIYDERLMPSPEDRASMTASSGFGSLSAHLFRTGRLGLFFSGRYMLLAFRQAAEQDGRPLPLGVVGLPHGGFPNSRALARSAAVYKGSENPALAKKFVEFLASDAY